ncbi:identical protein binding, partial [Homalodisca vitripennis]
PPFSGQVDYCNRKSELLSLSLEMATCAQRDRFAERPVEELRLSSSKMAVLADSIVRDIQDPLLLQPASLELVTLKKRSSDDLGFYIVPSFHGVHQIGALKLNSAAHQSGKLEPGDEIVQINYQTVVGCQVKQVMALFEESPTEVLLTVKKRLEAHLEMIYSKLTLYLMLKVGWQVKQVMALFEESPTEVLLTVKKRLRHTLR